MKLKLKKFLPVHLGGPANNVYNTFFRRFHPVLRFPLAIRRKPLWDFVKETKPERILEIGLGDGYNARKMMKLADDCEYYCFDTLYREESKEAYNDLKDEDNVSFFIGDTKKTLPLHVEGLPKMDLIFIDGGHDYETVKNDWECCRKLMHGKTVCFFHNYNSLGVKKVVDKIKGYSKEIIKLPKPLYNFALVVKKRGERSSNNDSNG